MISVYLLLDFIIKDKNVYPKSVIRISLCRTTQRNPNDRFGFKNDNLQTFVIIYLLYKIKLLFLWKTLI